MGEFIRLFVAIDCKELGEHFKDIQKKLPKDAAKMNFVKEFHLTLKFLGETDKLEEIKSALSRIKFNKFKLRLDKLGVFPSESYVRVVWIGLKGNSELERLQKDVEKELEKFHFRRDFEFAAHLTLARVKFISDKKGFFDVLKRIKVEEKEISVDEFKLIKSTLTPDGPVYEEMDVLKADKI